MKKKYFFLFLLISIISQAQVSQVVFFSTNGKAHSITSTSHGLLLYADDNPGINDTEPYISDGTSSGTFKLKDINPSFIAPANSDSGSDQGRFTEINATVFFVAKNGGNNFELWKTDGTNGGTVLVKDINGNGNSSLIEGLYVLNGSLIFAASDDVNGKELWISDGTSSGTTMLKDINPGAASSFPLGFCLLNSKLYFSADDGTSGRELWMTDGTASGTVLVKDLGAGSSNPQEITAFNNNIYFNAFGELYRSNGTVGSGALLRNININGDSNPSDFKEYNGRLYFSADDGNNGRELWSTNGTTIIGTSMVRNINPGIADSNPTNLTVSNSKLFFKANGGGIGNQLWVTDGTSANTMELVVNPSTSANITHLIDYNDKLYFQATNSSSVIKLWSSDGSPSGTQQIGGSYPNIINSRKMTVHNSELFFSTGNLYKYKDPTLSSIENIYYSEIKLFPNPSNSKFTIKTNALIERVEVRSILGNVVKVFNTIQDSYDVSSLGRGVYLVNIHSNNPEQTIKFIKN